MSTVTVDGTNGPGFDLEGVVFNNVTEIGLLASKGQLRLVQGSNDVTYIDISGTTIPGGITITLVSPTNYTVTIVNP